MLPMRILYVLAATSVLFSVAASLGQQPFVPTTYPPAGDATDQRLTQMQQEIDALRSRLDSQATCGECITDPCVYSHDSGFYAGGAIVFAKPYYKESFQATSTSQLTGQTDLLGFNFTYDATPRVWLGYSRATGWAYALATGDSTTPPNQAPTWRTGRRCSRRRR